MRWKVFCLILGIAALISCSEQSTDENLPTARNQDGFITEAVRDSHDVPEEIPHRIIVLEQPADINLVANDSIISVGGQSTEIRAYVFDSYGLPVNAGYIVRLEMTAFPGYDSTSPSFEHVPFDTAIHVVEVATDENGIASEELYSGCRYGTVRIKGTWIDDEDVFDEQNLVYIRAGLTRTIDIAQSNVPFPIGGMRITGLVWDQYTNPVEPLTEVFFELIPDTIAIIESPAYTGGWVDENGDTIGVRGLVHSFVSYSCDHTFDTVRVLAYADTIQDISDPIVLPLYEGEIDMWANPGMCYCQDLTDTVYSDVTAQLLDGLGCSIHDGIIIFTVEVCGNLEGQTIDTTDINGYAYALFRIVGNQIPDQPPPLPPACTAKVTGNLQGYPDVEGECEVYCQLVVIE